MTRERITLELEKQEQVQGLTENIKLLRYFLQHIKYASQWNAFVTVCHHSIGQYSYQTERFYFATEELKRVMAYNAQNKVQA